MATMTGTTVEVTIGEYTYRAVVDGNRVALFRDGASAGFATWGGQTIEDFPLNLAQDAHDELDAAIRENLGKAWRTDGLSVADVQSVADVPTAPVHATPDTAVEVAGQDAIPIKVTP